MFNASSLIFEGCVTATVTDNEDEEKFGRVKVQLIGGSLSGSGTDWIYCITKSPEQEYWLPNVGDRVVVAALDGGSMVVLGSIPKKDQLAIVDRANDPENAIKKIKTKAGIEATIDDKNKLASISTPGGRKISVSDGENSIIELTDGENAIKMNDDGVEIKSGRDLKLIAGDAKITFSSNSIQIVFGSSSINLERGGISVKGTQIELKADTSLSVESSSQLSLKGSITQINS